MSNELVEQTHATVRSSIRPAMSSGSSTPRPYPVENDVVSQLAMTKEYDSAAAYLLAVAAGWAYADKDALGMVMVKCGLTDVRVDEVGVTNPAMLVDVQAYLVTGKRGTSRIGIVCFRGTEMGGAETTDVLTDATPNLVPNFNRVGKVHKGFHRSVLYVWDYLTEAMRNAFFEPGEPPHLALDSLYITGHSLGAALAVVAANRLCNDPEFEKLRGVLHGIYTYGQPRVGDAEYARSCEPVRERLYRHIYGRDWIPALPPMSTGHYEHFGQLFVSTERGWESTHRPGIRALTLLGSGLIASTAFVAHRFTLSRWLMRLVQLKFSLEDHLPEYYVECSRRSQQVEFP